MNVAGHNGYRILCATVSAANRCMPLLQHGWHPTAAAGRHVLPSSVSQRPVNHQCAVRQWLCSATRCSTRQLTAQASASTAQQQLTRAAGHSCWAARSTPAEVLLTNVPLSTQIPEGSLSPPPPAAAAAAAAPAAECQQQPAPAPTQADAVTAADNTPALVATHPAGAHTPAATQHQQHEHWIHRAEVPEQVSFPDTTIQLHPYQQQVVAAAVEAWQGGSAGQMITLPTGTGKTIIFAAMLRYLAQQKAAVYLPPAGQPPAESANHLLAESDSSLSAESPRNLLEPHQPPAESPMNLLELGQSYASPWQGAKGEGHPCHVLRGLVLAHRVELLSQTVEKLQRVWPGVQVSLVNAERKEMHGQVVVASVQTARNRAEELAACNFDVVIVDEAHHATANSYMTILGQLGVTKQQQRPAGPGASDSSSSSPGSNSSNGMTSSSSSSTSPVLTASGSTSPGSSSDPASSTDEIEIQLTNSSSDEGSSSEPAETAAAGAAAAAGVLETVLSGHKLLLGFTATPYRMSGQQTQLLQRLLRPTFNRDIAYMVKEGYLCKVRALRVQTPADLRSVASRGGDWAQGELSRVLNSPDRNRLVVQAYLDYATDRYTDTPADAESGTSSSSSSSSKDRSSSSSSSTLHGRRRKALLFAVDISHCEDLHREFAAAGVRSAVIHSRLHKRERAATLEAFRQGGVPLLINCEVLTEGFDEPAVDAVLMARPTRSTGLYTQMLGRGLRLHPGKQDCLVIDFTDRVHNLRQPVTAQKVVPVIEDLTPSPPKPDPSSSSEEEEEDHPAPCELAVKEIAQLLQGGEFDILGIQEAKIEEVLTASCPAVLDPWSLKERGDSCHRDMQEALRGLPFSWVPVGPHWVLECWMRKERVWVVHEQTVQQIQQQLDTFKTQLQASTATAATAAAAGAAGAAAAAAAAEAEANSQAAAAAAGDAVAPLTTPAGSTTATQATSGAAGEGDQLPADSETPHTRLKQQQAESPLQGSLTVSADAPDSQQANAWGVMVMGMGRGGQEGHPRRRSVLVSQASASEAAQVALRYLSEKLSVKKELAVLLSSAGWRSSTPSSKQLQSIRELLRMAHPRTLQDLPPQLAQGELPGGMCRGEASDIISALKSQLASKGQRLQLLAAGATWTEPLLASHAAARLKKLQQGAGPSSEGGSDQEGGGGSDEGE